MPLRPLDQVTPGMRTAVSVVDAGGVVLVNAGVALTAELIDRLRRRQISSVDVDTPATASYAPEDAAAAEASLTHAFEKSLGQPVMQALYEAAVARARRGRK